jgi:hypothetical protein
VRRIVVPRRWVRETAGVVVCFLAINSRIIDKVFCIPCFS